MPLVIPYQSSWPADYQSIRRYIESGISCHKRIEHIGSTSIPEMVAKPIIDLIIVVREGKMADLISELSHLEYRYQGDLGVPGREAFDYLPPHIELPRHHLYASYPGAAQLNGSLAFRDYMRKEPNSRRQLSELKLQLDRQFASDRKKYMEGKKALVEEIISRALGEKGRPA